MTDFNNIRYYPSQAKAPHLIIDNITNLRHKLITSNNLKLIHNLTLASQPKRQVFLTAQPINVFRVHSTRDGTDKENAAYFTNLASQNISFVIT